MKVQRSYWDKKITEWAAVSYGRGPRASLVERIAAPFRAADKRVKIASLLLAPFIEGKVVLVLGCGVGNECFSMLRSAPKRIVGIDISPVAISLARKIAKRRKLEGKVELLVADVGSMRKIPTCDYIIGLGFLDYLEKNELRNLFKLISPRSNISQLLTKPYQTL